jgi:hypothetical protein
LEEEAPPEGIPVAMGVLRNGPIESDDEEDAPKAKPEKHVADDTALKQSEEDERSSQGDDVSDDEATKVPDNPPLLPDLEAGESFNFPSRIQSTRTNRQPSQRTARGVELELIIPEVPRKSSKRNSSGDRMNKLSLNLPPPMEASRGLHPDAAASARLPFDRTNSQKRLSGSSLGDLPSAGLSGDSGDDRPTSIGYVHHHNINRIDPSSDQDIDLLGSTAEVVDNSRRVSPMSSASGLSTRAL